MPVWLVEFFGSQSLNEAFWLVTCMTAPVWLLLILLPRWKVTRHLSHPFFFPTLYACVWVYILFQLFTLTGAPVVEEAGFGPMRRLVRHPIIFLLFWSHFQVLNLFLGTVIYREAFKRKTVAPVELLLAWVAGPLGLIAFGVRSWISNLKQ